MRRVRAEVMALPVWLYATVQIHEQSKLLQKGPLQRKGGQTLAYATVEDLLFSNCLDCDVFCIVCVVIVL